ncbi:MAG: hypothetical protein OXC53_05385, partial [Rhodobacteraceae bacterium]|nr:hypothetical protein [Paracoccaceae bacterium]
MFAVIFPPIAFLVASLLAAFLGWFGIQLVENAHHESATAILEDGGYSWASARTDGLIVEIAGIAPSTDVRDAALGSLRALFGQSNVHDKTNVAALPDGLDQILNLQKLGDSIEIFGAIIGEDARRELISSSREKWGERVTDITLQTLPGNSREHWKSELKFIIEALAIPEIIRIEMRGDDVKMTAVVNSEVSETEVIAKLDRIQADGPELAYQLNVVPDLDSPPFTFNAQINPSSSRILDCIMETKADREQIIATLSQAERIVTGTCQLASGAPDENWRTAIINAVNAVTSSDSVEILVSGREIRLMPLNGETDDRLRSANIADVPPGYRIVRLSPPPDTDFQASTVRIAKGANGNIEFDGGFPSETERKAAILSSSLIFDSAVIEDNSIVYRDQDDPDGESIIVAGEALNLLYAGTLTISEDRIVIDGITDTPTGEEQVLAFLLDHFDPHMLDLRIHYDARINAPPEQMTPTRCVTLFNDVQAKSPIKFSPGSAQLTTDAWVTIDGLLELVDDCAHLPIEVAGHTDSP